VRPGYLVPAKATAVAMTDNALAIIIALSVLILDALSVILVTRPDGMPEQLAWFILGCSLTLTVFTVFAERAVRRIRRHS
jgi:hypothetical protein